MKTLGEAARLLDGAEILGSSDTEISGLCYDSRKVCCGDLFVCINGFKSDGHKFALKAAENGAAALVVEYLPEGAENIPCIKVKDTRKALAVLAAEKFDHPADKLVSIGLTGTNGKTTTSYLIKSVIEAGSRSCGLIGTIEAHIGDKVRKVANTTPESYELQSMFSEMVEAEQDSVVMEVSSHALALNRTYGIDFNIAVFTNLTQDHLDFHETMENYFQTKAKLFTDLENTERKAGPFAVINIDDEYGRRLIEMLKDKVPVITYGTDKDADVRAFAAEATPKGLEFILESRLGSLPVEMSISGKFNLHNALAAAAVGIALGMPLKKIVKGLDAVKAVPGRFQLVSESQDFTVIVDYAHTPDGLGRLLDSAREITKEKLYAVFGCGGDRDKTKRPVMGRIAAEKADKIFITTDNPRSEAPEAIVSDILSGIPEELRYKAEVIYDRAEAVAKAVKLARTGDTVVIAGKGHEKYQIFSDRTIDFDDVKVSREVLKGLRSMHTPALHKVSLPTKYDRSAFDVNQYNVSLTAGRG